MSHAANATPGPDGSDESQEDPRVGAVTSVAIGVAELRNPGYTTGHGAGRPGSASNPRLAQRSMQP